MELLTVAQAARLLGLKPATIRFWIWTRKIDYVKIGRSVRLRKDTLESLIGDGTIPALRRELKGEDHASTAFKP